VSGSTTRQPDFEIGASVELQIIGYDRTGGLQLATIPEYDVDRMSFSATPTISTKLGGSFPYPTTLRTPAKI
jgi:hypothetical protein